MTQFWLRCTTMTPYLKNAPGHHPQSDMMREIWVMRTSLWDAQGVLWGRACHRERWWSLARVCNKCKCPQREEGGSCSGESWSYNGIHWVAESLAPERISSMRNVPSESFRISRGSWNLPPSLGICLSERGHWQGMALEALHWFAQNAQSQIDWKVSHYW